MEKIKEKVEVSNDTVKEPVKVTEKDLEKFEKENKSKKTEKKELTDLEVIEQSYTTLLTKRTTEEVEIKFFDLSDIKHLIKTLTQEGVWKGTQGVTLVSLINKLKKADVKEIDEDGKTMYSMKLEPSYIEYLSFFLNEFKGKGYYSAKGLMGPLYAVNIAGTKLLNIDKQLKKLNKEIEDSKEKPKKKVTVKKEEFKKKTKNKD